MRASSDRPFIWTSFKHLDWTTFTHVLWHLASLPNDVVEFTLPRRIPKWLRCDRFVPTARVVRR